MKIKNISTLFLFCLVAYSISAQQYFGKSKEVALTSITPQGWLKEFLQRQADGLGGNPTVSGYPFNTNMWMEDIHIPVGHAGKELWPYEQTAYFIDGTLRCGYLLDDTSLINYARKNINYTLSNVEDDGVLGPSKSDDWSRVVYFRALMAEYDVTGDVTILNAMKVNYLKPERLFNNGRGLLSIEQILWLYGKTGDQKLLNLAIESFHNSKSGLGGEYKNGKEAEGLPSKLLDQMLSDKIPHGHGVGNMEQSKIPAIFYMYTGNQKYLDASINQFEKFEKHHMLVDGCPSSVEHLSGKAIDMAHETCDVIDLSWSAGYLLMATQDGHYGDLIERAIFNAGLGALDKYFKAHQYYSAPNQPVAAEETSQFNIDKSWGGMAKGRMCYRTGHDTECCTGNIQRMMPSYASRMWLKNSGNSGVTAALYGASEFKFQRNNSEIKIQEETNYPFDDTIEFTFDMKEKSKFDFTMRIPAWCNQPEIYLNGKRLRRFEIEKGMVTIHRKFVDGDRISLKLPMELKLTTWGVEKEGIAIERGPLVYSLPVANKTITFPFIGDPKLVDFPNKLLYPISSWNYALDINSSNDAKVVYTNIDNKEYPWDLENVPVKITVPAIKVANWKIDGTKHAPKFPNVLQLEGQQEMIELVPSGATYLRMTIFPKKNMN